MQKEDVDVRLEFMSEYILKSLKLKIEKWNKFITGDERVNIIGSKKEVQISRCEVSAQASRLNVYNKLIKQIIIHSTKKILEVGRIKNIPSYKSFYNLRMSFNRCLLG